MTQPSSILVIGAGLLGLSSADSLLRSGAKITIIDGNHGPARETSFANSGMIHPSQACPWNSEHLSPKLASESARSVYALAQRSKTLIRKRAIHLGLKQNMRIEGCLQIFETKTQRDRKASLYTHDKIAASIVEPSKDSFNRPALFFKGDISGNAFEYCTALEKALKQRGVKFKYNCKITNISRDYTGGVVINAGGETFHANQVVIAAGDASAEILRPLGIILKTYPERGFAMDFKKPKFNLPKIPIMDAASKSAMTVFEDRVRFSGTIGEAEANTLIKIWTQIAPNLIAKLDDPIQIWSANRPMSLRGRPYIGRTSVDGIWVNTGHGHMGWTLSAGSGDLLAKMMLDNFLDKRFQV